MPPETAKAVQNVRLKRFFMLVRFFAFTVVIAVALLFIFRIEFFPFIIYPRLFLSLLAGITIFSLIFYFLIVPHSTKKSVLYTNNVAWAIFLTTVIYATGGTWSPWSVILLFPIITTAFDLEAAAAVVIGGLIIALVGIITGLDYVAGRAGSLSLGLFLMFYLSLYTFYIYRVIKETLRQKYEKEETKRLYGELLEMDRIKSDFITLTSHQLRTPLTELRWALDTVLQRKQEVGEEIRSILEKSQTSTERMVGIMDEMLKIPALEQQDPLLKLEKIEAAEFLRAIYQGFELLAKQKSVSLRLVLPEEVNISADREKLRLALENVIDNAIRYSPNGNVTITLRRDQNLAIIRVQDSGVGIAYEDQERIFTKFFRGKNAMLLEPNESGVGLYISKRIIEKHGGTISFASQLKQGTTFTITLPLGA